MYGSECRWGHNDQYSPGRRSTVLPSLLPSLLLNPLVNLPPNLLESCGLSKIPNYKEPSRVLIFSAIKLEPYKALQSNTAMCSSWRVSLKLGLIVCFRIALFVGQSLKITEEALECIWNHWRSIEESLKKPHFNCFQVLPKSAALPNWSA